MVMISGKVTAGRGLASQHLGRYQGQLEELLGAPPMPGTLNVCMSVPHRFSADSGVWLDRATGRMVWLAEFNSMPVLLYRWGGCPLTVVEVISNDHLRRSHDLKDGAQVQLRVERGGGRISVLSWLGWLLLWSGRQHLYYTNGYADYIVSIQRFFCLTQDERRISVSELVMKMIGKFSLGFRAIIRKRRLFFMPGTRHSFVRRKVAPGHDGRRDRVLNLLAYTKTSGSCYSAERYPAGYHSVLVDGEWIAGQRFPGARLDHLPLSLEGVRVLDIGCNQGGMLFEALRRGIAWGIGIDFDPRMINAANKIRQNTGAHDVHFFSFDLEREELGLVCDFLPDDDVDIVFLLSVCMWIRNWREVIAFSARLAPNMFFESNGSEEQQDSQEACLRENYSMVSRLLDKSDDDAGQKNRRLYFCAR